jgi:hypothetical protein
MGMFKNMRDLQKMGREMEADLPPAGQRMADAQARMAQAQNRMANMQQMMANQTAAANAAAGLADGSAVKRTVVINSMQQVGMINFDLMIQFDLTVMQDGMPPMPATTQQTVSQMQIGQIRPGMTCDAAVDPNNPAAIWLDLNTAR